jgi:hypothetical protein
MLFHGEDESEYFGSDFLGKLLEPSLVKHQGVVELKYLLALDTNGDVVRLGDGEVFADGRCGVQLMKAVGAWLRLKSGHA